MIEKIVLNPNLAWVKLITSEIPPTEFASAHVILFDKNHKIVLVREAKDKSFNLPGGHRENQETASETTIRECLEELGSKIDQKSLLYLGDLVFGQLVFPLFFIQGVDDIQYDKADFEIEAFDWEKFLGMTASINPELSLKITELISTIVS